MQGSYVNLRIMLSFLVMFLVSACGGGGSSSGSDTTETGEDRSNSDAGPFTVGGTITGLEDYVVLSLNGVTETFSTASFTFTQELDGGTEYNVAFVSSGADISCTVINGSGTANADVLGVSVSCIPTGEINYLCDSHGTMVTNVIGNNTYEFIAQGDDCFATTEDFSLEKREVAVSLNLEEEFEDILSVSGVAKLTTKEVPSSLGTYTRVTLSAEITNESEAVICLNLKSERAVMHNGETEVSLLLTDLLGDMFYENGSYKRKCIPAGQTRTVWGSGYNIYDEGELEALDNILLQPTDIEVYALDDDHYFLPALSPSEALWTSTREEIAGNDYYGYEIDVIFENETTAPLMLRSELSRLYYFDNEGYFLYDSLASVPDFLNIDDDDLTDDHLIIGADGGSIGLRDDFYPIVPAFGDTGNILGRSRKIIMNLNVCYVGDINC